MLRAKLMDAILGPDPHRNRVWLPGSQPVSLDALNKGLLEERQYWWVGGWVGGLARGGLRRRCWLLPGPAPAQCAPQPSRLPQDDMASRLPPLHCRCCCCHTALAIVARLTSPHISCCCSPPLVNPTGLRGRQTARATCWCCCAGAHTWWTASLPFAACRCGGPRRCSRGSRPRRPQGRRTTGWVEECGSGWAHACAPCVHSSMHAGRRAWPSHLYPHRPSVSACSPHIHAPGPRFLQTVLDGEMVVDDIMEEDRQVRRPTTCRSTAQYSVVWMHVRRKCSASSTANILPACMYGALFQRATDQPTPHRSGALCWRSHAAHRPFPHSACSVLEPAVPAACLPLPCVRAGAPPDSAPAALHGCLSDTHHACFPITCVAAGAAFPGIRHGHAQWAANRRPTLDGGRRGATHGSGTRAACMVLKVGGCARHVPACLLAPPKPWN